jgi:hypothetical protein
MPRTATFDHLTMRAPCPSKVYVLFGFYGMPLVNSSDGLTFRAVSRPTMKHHGQEVRRSEDYHLPTSSAHAPHSFSMQ